MGYVFVYMLSWDHVVNIIISLACESISTVPVIIIVWPDQAHPHNPLKCDHNDILYSVNSSYLTLCYGRALLGVYLCYY